MNQSANERSDMFRLAFGGKREGDKATALGQQQMNSDQRTEAFLSAFAPRRDLPKPTFTGWRMNAIKAARLSFAELMEVEELRTAHVGYDNLPAWIRDSGVAVPDADVKREQDRLTKETGLDLTQRQELFSAFEAEVAALDAMSRKEILQGSPILDGEFKTVCARFGTEQVLERLAELNPEAAKDFVSRQRVQAAEAKAAEAKAISEADTRRDLQQAREAIEAMNQQEAGDA